MQVTHISQTYNKMQCNAIQYINTVYVVLMSVQVEVPNLFNKKSVNLSVGLQIQVTQTHVIQTC
jgi:hypothetical protein